MHRKVFLPVVLLLAMTYSAAAQNNTWVITTLRRPGDITSDERQVWMKTMFGCVEMNAERVRKDYADLLQQAGISGIAVRLTAKTEIFDVETELVHGDRNDEVIINFYGTSTTDTSRGRSCNGVLWVGSKPVQLR